jgi:Ni/Fe-hydrogenase subunit HybB-like protein
LASVIAALVILVEGLILSMSVGGPLWHGGMLPVVFLVEGLLTAAAILLIAPAEPSISGWLRLVMLVLLPALVVLNLLEIAAASYAGNPEAQAAITLFWNGRLTPLFWGQAVLGLLVPFVLLAGAAKNRTAMILAAGLVILGGWVTKLGVLISGQALPFMQAEATYVPTLVEVAGVIGIVGLAGFLFLLGRHFISLRQA